jgi:hypothetical protein
MGSTDRQPAERTVIHQTETNVDMTARSKL